LAFGDLAADCPNDRIRMGLWLFLQLSSAGDSRAMPSVYYLAHQSPTDVMPRTATCQYLEHSIRQLTRGTKAVVVSGVHSMRTPHCISASEYADALKHFLDDFCLPNGNALHCRKCGASIRHIRATLTIHNSTCGGCDTLGPSSWNTVVPYCPKCEAKPDRRGCLHHA
jgi:hypothetical protein